MSKRDEIAAIVDQWCDLGSIEVVDRILACMAEPSEAMVDAARAEYIRRDATGAQHWETMHAALVAAGKAMGGDDGKDAA